MSIRTKILGGFIIVVVIGALLGGIGVISSQILTAQAHEVKAYQIEASSFATILNAHNTWRNGLTSTVITGAEFKGSRPYRLRSRQLAQQ